MQGILILGCLYNVGGGIQLPYRNSGTELAKIKLEVITFLTHFAGEVSGRPNPFFSNYMPWPLGRFDTEYYLVIHRKRQRPQRCCELLFVGNSGKYQNSIIPYLI
jgi:hypothetical protein